MRKITYNGITVNIDDAVFVDVQRYIAVNEVPPASCNMAGAASISAPSYSAPAFAARPEAEAPKPCYAARPKAEPKRKKGILAGFKLSSGKKSADKEKKEKRGTHVKAEKLSAADIAPPEIMADACYELEESAELEVAIESAIPDAAIDDILSNVEDTFQTHLLKLIDKKEFTDSEVYKKADIDRRHFSKIRSNPEYRPKKATAVALALALELNIDEATDLLGRAGYAFSPSSRADLIARYCIEHRIYDLMEVNALLYYYDQPLLGGQMM